MIFALRYFKGDPLAFFIYLLFTLVAVTISLVLHELAHGLVAKWNGDKTAKYAGRLTLNPLKHFDLIGFIMLMTVGFGYAKPVPVDPTNFKRRRLGLVTVSVAGVIMNLILAVVSAFLFVVMLYAYTQAESMGAMNFCLYIANFFEIMVTLNLSLLFFNILPIYPLDGFRLVESFTRRGNHFCNFMRVNGRYILMGLVALSFIISMAFDRVPLPAFFRYFDVLGTYLNFFTGKLSSLFVEMFAPIFF